MIKHILVALLATVALSGCSLSEYHGTTSFECIGGEMSRGSDQPIDQVHPNMKRIRYVVTLGTWPSNSDNIKVHVNGVEYDATGGDGWYSLYSSVEPNTPRGTFYAKYRYLFLNPDPKLNSKSSVSASCIKHPE